MRSKTRIQFSLKALVLAGGMALLSTMTLHAESAKFWTDKSTPRALTSQAFGLNLFSDLVDQVSPAVVNIKVLAKVPPQPFGDFPYGRPVPPPPTQKDDQFQESGQGSGFFISPDGYLLTNAHVIAKSDNLQVALKDGSLFYGTVVGIDEVMDIGLVKIKADQPLPYLPLGKSETLKIGEWVMAIGSPFGLEQTVTVGIVSAKGRTLGASPFDDFIQIDATINPGNSGGPLINMQGEVVGINTMILAQGQGLGFSLPINQVRHVLNQLKQSGKVSRSWLGVVIQEITIELKHKHGLPAAHGAFILEVVENSPAARAGILAYDVVLEFNGQKIKTSRELPLVCAHSPSGVSLPMKVFRKGKEVALQVVLDRIPESKH